MTTFDYEVLTFDHDVDGDTVDLTLSKWSDFGFHLTEEKRFKSRFRVLGIDTPERGEPRYREASAFTTSWLQARAGGLRATTYKDPDVFGRYLADIYDPETGEHLTQALLDAGYPVWVKS